MQNLTDIVATGNNLNATQPYCVHSINMEACVLIYVLIYLTSGEGLLSELKKRVVSNFIGASVNGILVSGQDFRSQPSGREMIIIHYVIIHINDERQFSSMN